MNSTLAQFVSCKEMICIESYIHLHYYEFYKATSDTFNMIVPYGVVQIIHNYCMPFYFSKINALQLSSRIVTINPAKPIHPDLSEFAQNQNKYRGVFNWIT